MQKQRLWCWCWCWHWHLHLHLPSSCSCSCDVRAFEEHHQAPSTNVKKNTNAKGDLKFEWPPTANANGRFNFKIKNCRLYDHGHDLWSLCSLTMKESKHFWRTISMNHIHTRVRSAIGNIDSANETSTVEPPSGVLAHYCTVCHCAKKKAGLLRTLNKSWADSKLNRSI